MSRRVFAVRLLWLSSGIALSSCNCGTDRPLQKTEAALIVPIRDVDFGPVQEFTNKGLGVEVQNVGRAPLTLSAALEAGGSPDFTLVHAPDALDPTSSEQVQINFAPTGGGTDEATLVITSDDPAAPETRVTLRGGPIAPAVTFQPDPLSFVPSLEPLVTKQARVVNSGLSTLTVSAVGVALGGNPDFSVTPPQLPAHVKPGESWFVDVSYARSSRKEDGQLELHSDEPDDGGVRFLRLIPDPAKACGNGIDDDGDGLIDFPDDPGCSGTTDDDEYNPPECLPGATQPCGMSTGACKQGTRSCMNGLWGACVGAVNPSAEICDGLDNDCNGKTDDGVTETCTINGCGGARACVEDSGVDGGVWLACQPAGAMPEQCDGVDNDCDGQIDEGVSQSCMINGCAGSQLCVPGGTGTWTQCQPTSASAETCNGVDDDCNGAIDDGLPMLSCGTGACAVTTPSCVNGATATCTPGTPMAETCNGIDDDCNGAIDDLPALSCGTGACANTAPACVNGANGTCSPKMPGSEVCNGLDDDCDGTADENLSQSCYSGPSSTLNVGPCHAGTQSCSNGSWGSCSGQVVPAATEICGNSVDDNCNGQLDEGCTASCTFTPSTGPDAQEPNQSMGTAKPIVSPAAYVTTTYTYDITLPSGDTDWIRINIPTSGSTTEARAEILCVNYGGSGCGATVPSVGLYLWYKDSFGSQLDAQDNGKNGLAVVQSSGPIDSSGFFAPQYWYVNAYPSSVVCTSEAVNATLKITVTNY